MGYQSFAGGEAAMTPAHIALASTLAVDICALPAVPLRSWCDRAATIIERIRPGSYAFVAVAQMDSRQLVTPELQGVSRTLDRNQALALQLRSEPQAWVGAALGAPAQWHDPSAGRLTRLDPGKTWAGTRRGRVWMGMRHAELLVGAVAISHGRDRVRSLLVELALPEHTPAFSRGDEEVLRSSLMPLGKKATLAFRDQPEEDHFAPLTRREQEILERLTLGKSVKQIASEMDRSPHTVHDHVKSLHRKLNASSRGELVARALGHMTLLNDDPSIEPELDDERPAQLAPAMAG